MTQGELEKIPLPFEQAMSELEMRIMAEIARAIKINGFSTSTADAQIRCLLHLGKSKEEIRKYIKKALSVTDEELEKIFSDTVYKMYYGYGRGYDVLGKEQIPFKENRELQELIAAVQAQTKDTFKNITNSLGFAIRNPATGRIKHTPLLKFYQDTLTGAVLDIATGSASYDKALSRVINMMTNSGMRWIDYESGVHSRVNVAARRAVMTGFRQIQGKINEQVARELETDSFEVTYHIGARPSHQAWQGRVYSYDELKSVCGLGTVTGLNGANCYHDYNAFIPGISVRTYTDEQLEAMTAEENRLKKYNGKKYTTYGALQEQRRMETAMRKTRQDIKLLQEGGADEDEVTIKKVRYQLEMQQYKAFSKAMKLPEQIQRVYQDGLGRLIRGTAPKPKRKEENTGDFKNLQIPLQKRYIEKIASKYGIKIQDINIKIQRDKDLLSVPLCGSTDYDDIGRIDLFPNAFKDEETLVRTIIHERCHVLQLRKHGKGYAQEYLDEMEKEAYRFEDFWYNIVRKKVKG